jgi:hypothetical protein
MFHTKLRNEFNTESHLVSISPTFYKGICANSLAPIKSFTITASTKKLRVKLSYEKAAHKMLVKLTLFTASVSISSIIIVLPHSVMLYSLVICLLLSENSSICDLIFLKHITQVTVVLGLLYANLSCASLIFGPYLSNITRSTFTRILGTLRK